MGGKAERPKKKHRLLKLAFLAAGAAGIAYAVAQKQRPGTCIPAGSPEERLLVKDQENLSGLGLIMQNLVGEFLKSPAKQALLDTMNFSVAIEPTEQPETAITLTFSDGYLVIEPGAVPSADIKIMCDIESLLQMAGMGSGLAAVQFMAGPDGQKMARKFLSGEIRIQGLAAHPIGMLKFSNFLAPVPG